MSNKIGKVWLVGAGPSDVELLTVKAKNLIENAEVIVYDSLVGAGIMALIPETAEIINVGKRAGNHTVPQEGINQILLDKALEGKRVVRLKGGDPFLFGRGGEELELLVENDVPFEIVPGVTSAIAVPAYNGIPVTHRDFTSSLHIITGHKRAGKKLDIKFKSLVEMDATLVFLMGVGALHDICEGLIEAGMDVDTPAAILQQGTTAGQKKIIATVSSLEAEVEKQGIETPAIIVVGKVCSLGNEFAWYEKLPLFGQRIIVTRPKESISTLSAKLRTLGAEVIESPSIRTEKRTVNDEIKTAIENISDYNYGVFTSPAGVRFFMEDLMEVGKDIRALAGLKIAVIGRGTAKEFKNYGIVPDLMPEIFDAEHLGIIVGEAASDGDKILIPRASQGSEELIAEIVKRKNVVINDLPIYDTIHEAPVTLDLEKQIGGKKVTMAVFTSASTVRGFMDVAGTYDLSGMKSICIGKQTAAEAEKYGLKIYVSKQATIDALIDCVINTVNN